MSPPVFSAEGPCPGTPPPLSTTIHFGHDETVNTGEGTPPCCADIVTISGLSFDALINVGPDVYYFTLLGFSQDGGLTFDSVLSSSEMQTSSTALYGVMSLEPRQPLAPMPEPATMLLFATGLAGIATIVRRRDRRSR